MTKDHDRKALIRARMEKTGESYTTARMHIVGEDPAAAAPTDDPTPKTAFAMPNDESAIATRRELRDAVEKMYEHTGIEIRGDKLEVWMGDPRVFSASIPLSSIASVELIPDRKPGTSLGVHGSRGRWLVNSAYTASSASRSLPQPQRRSNRLMQYPRLRGERAPASSASSCATGQ